MFTLTHYFVLFDYRLLIILGGPGSYAPGSQYGQMGGPPGGPNGQKYPGGMYGGIEQYDKTLGRGNAGPGTYNAKFNPYGGSAAQYGGQGPQYG